MGRDQAREVGLIVSDLEANEQVQDTVLSIHHATMHTFSATAVAKIIENHRGRAWINHNNAGMPMPVTTPVPAIPVDGLETSEETPKGLSRAERRRRERAEHKRR